MRIRFYSYFYPPCVGGGEVILQHQAEELARRGHEVHVHTTTYANLNLRERVSAGSSVEGGVHVHRRASFRLPFRNPLEQDAVTPAFAADAFLPADLRVCVGYPSLHLDALTLAPGPLVVQNYVTAEFLDEILRGEGGPNKKVRAAYWRRWTRRQLRAADLVIADSPGAGRALAERLGLANVRVHVGMAVDPDEFDRADPAAARARLGLGDARIVLAPSRLAPQKGADLLVRALAGHLPAGWRLVIPGAVNDEAFAAEVRRLAEGHDVVFGPVPRDVLCGLFRAADVVVLPSRGETVGGVIFEGMYCGALAVVSDAVEAAREDYLKDGENGLLVRSGDVGALRAAVLRGAGEDTTAMRAAGRRMVRERFTWARSVDRLVALYEEATRA
ncbi:MAG: glycosyltransferase family 4 protein [Myxococcota bacterium]